MSPLVLGYIYVHTSSDGLPLWSILPEAFQAKGKRQRVKIVSGPRLQYVSLLADRQRVRLRIRAKVRRRLELVLGPRKEPRFGLNLNFEEFWTLQRRGEDWILWSPRSTKFRKEYTTEPIVSPGQEASAPATVAPA